MEAQGNGFSNGTQSPNGGGVTDLLQRNSFPEDFIFGTASAAYQYEGASKAGGRGPSVWDDFAHRWPGRIADGSNGNDAIGFYHRYKEDVKIMKRMGLDAFRFSISWPRILPSGQLNQGVNQEGVKFYNDLIDELVANGIQPYVTLFHWDVPQALVDKYGGLLSSDIVADFCDFADVCFWEFGDRVKHWITLNEPYSVSSFGYCTGAHAPGRGATAAFPVNSSGEDTAWTFQAGHRSTTKTPVHPIDNGNPGTEPYIVTHNQLLMHAAAVDLYRKNYQECHKGKIGATIVSVWLVPYTNSKADIEAKERALDFIFGWFMDPLVNGHYPHVMRKFVGSRLPQFSEIESEKLKGSYDFIGINYYTSMYVADAQNSSDNETLSYATDPKVKYTCVKDGVPIGPLAGGSWLYIYPEGFYELLVYTKKKYKNPVIYITENGVCEEDDIKKRLTEVRVDKIRKEYLAEHLRQLKEAIDDGVKVKGYFQWSFLDNYEWADGYTMRFGMIYVDYRSGNLARYPKDSAIWFMNFLKNANHTAEPVKKLLGTSEPVKKLLGTTEPVKKIVSTVSK